MQFPMQSPKKHKFTDRLFSRVKIGLTLALLVNGSAAMAELGEPEKDELRFGFIKLTDMAPIAVAYENGYFEDEGLYVTIEAQANWKVLLDGVIDGKLDGAHMLAGQPLAATIGYGTKAPYSDAFQYGSKRECDHCLQRYLGADGGVRTD